MTATPAVRERTLTEIEKLCYAGLDAETLCRRVAGRLHQVVGFEGYAFSKIDPLSGLTTGFVHNREIGSTEEAIFFIEHIYFEDEINDYGWMARNRIPVARLSDGTAGKPESALRYREFLAPKGFGYEVRTVLTAGGKLWGGLCLVREKGDGEFSEREVALLGRISAHLGAGLRAATLHPEARFEPANDDAAGVLILDHEGRLAHRTAAAERLLEELGGQAPRGGKDSLPSAVWAVVGALRQRLGSNPGKDAPDALALHVRGRLGRWLTLQASLTESEGDAAAETVVVISPASPKEVALLGTGAYGLSNREEEIVSLVVRGLSTRQISRALYISESTVQGHLSHVFEKAGVRSRRELLKRLFLDNLYSSFQG